MTLHCSSLGPLTHLSFCMKTGLFWYGRIGDHVTPIVKQWKNFFGNWERVKFNRYLFEESKVASWEANRWTKWSCIWNLEFGFFSGCLSSDWIWQCQLHAIQTTIRKWSYRAIVEAFVGGKSPVRCDDVNVNPSHSWWLIYLICVPLLVAWSHLKCLINSALIVLIFNCVAQLAAKRFAMLKICNCCDWLFYSFFLSPSISSEMFTIPQWCWIQKHPKTKQKKIQPLKCTFLVTCAQYCSHSAHK